MGMAYRGVCECGFMTQRFWSGGGILPIWETMGWREEEPTICTTCMAVYARDRLKEHYTIKCPACGHAFRKRLLFPRFGSNALQRIVSCPSCRHEIVVDAERKKRCYCPKCRSRLRFYFSDSPIDSALDSKETNLCPECGQKRMQFKVEISSD